MIPLLAQTDAPANLPGFWQWLLALGFLISVATNVVTIVSFSSNKKLRREVNFAFEPASKREFDEHTRWNAGDHEKLWLEIKAVELRALGNLDRKITEFMQSSDESRAKLHGRVDEILENVAELRGEVRARRS